MKLAINTIGRAKQAKQLMGLAIEYKVSYSHVFITLLFLCIKQQQQQAEVYKYS
jgi:hypothetical protein